MIKLKILFTKVLVYVVMSDLRAFLAFLDLLTIILILRFYRGFSFDSGFAMLSKRKSFKRLTYLLTYLLIF